MNQQTPLTIGLQPKHLAMLPDMNHNLKGGTGSEANYVIAQSTSFPRLIVSLAFNTSQEDCILHTTFRIHIVK